MSHPVDPKLFGLHHTIQLEKSGEKEFVIVSLRTTAPVCSKTKVHLQANKVEIVE